MERKEIITSGQAVLGIELGSTRIKAVLIGPDHAPIASGDHSWENRYEGGYWTYSLEDVWTGLQDAYAHLSADVEARYGVKLTRVASMGFSAMMHGYLPFGHEGQLLAPFRTWRNTTTGQAAEILSERFNFNIPQRWSIAHLYQAILNGEDHVPDVAFITTLAGYVHWKLTGENVLGVGDASGVFPIDSNTCDYDQAMVDSFDALVADKGYSWKLRDILPRVAGAGDNAGTLTAEGAKLLDPTGTLQPGAILCPPEGDAGTGMAATNAVAKRTGNVSAGTSVFSMIVLEKPLSRRYEEIDMVAEHCREKGVGFAMNRVFAEGAAGGEELARLVVDTIEKTPSEPLRFTYEDNDPVKVKIQKVAESIYGASSVTYTTLADKKVKQIESLGISHYPICIAKTQYSFSSDPKAYGVAKDFELKVRDIVINNGAEMIVVIMGEIMRMPGLPKEPQALKIDIVNGQIEGLS